MICPITCSQCKAPLGWYDTLTGCLQEFLPKAVFGAYLPCAKCHQVYRFDGLKTIKKAKEKRKRTLPNACI